MYFFDSVQHLSVHKSILLFERPCFAMKQPWTKQSDSKVRLVAFHCITRAKELLKKLINRGRECRMFESKKSIRSQDDLREIVLALKKKVIYGTVEGYFFVILL